MEILIRFERKVPGLTRRKISRKLEKILKDFACRDRELSILFTDDQRISDLNQHYLGRSGPTNVLAFPMEEEPIHGKRGGMLGDVVISVDRAAKESEESGETLEETIDRLLIHGILHLFGFDHERSPADAKKMRREEQKLKAVMREE